MSDSATKTALGPVVAACPGGAQLDDFRLPPPG
jgi:hypothetical protein